MNILISFQCNSGNQSSVQKNEMKIKWLKFFSNVVKKNPMDLKCPWNVKHKLKRKSLGA